MNEQHAIDSLLPVSAPGDILRREFMEPHGLTAVTLALALDMQADQVFAILQGRCAITTDTAQRLARHFGTSAAFWLNLQADHDSRQAVGKKEA